MTTSRDWAVACAVFLALAGFARRADAQLDPELVPPPSVRTVYARLSLGFAVGHVHDVTSRDFAPQLAWDVALGGHTSSGLAIHASAWGTSGISDAWLAFGYHRLEGRVDFVALGPGVTLRHPSGTFLTASVGGAYLHARDETADEVTVDRGGAFTARLAAGFELPIDEAGPRFGASLGATYLHPMSSESGFYDDGVDLELALTATVR